MVFLGDWHQTRALLDTSGPLVSSQGRLKRHSMHRHVAFRLAKASLLSSLLTVVPFPVVMLAFVPYAVIVVLGPQYAAAASVLSPPASTPASVADDATTPTAGTPHA